MSVAQQAKRRRTFAIISHPDAGKTTLTEKLLLYANAIHLAGSVKARRSSRHATSDWMQMEQERGISITSSVLQFEHKGCVLNLLDTPGHADFSEDTYRTLAAVDSAVMLMDHSKGVEDRTRKLFEVCRLRKIPVITFMNKLDRNGLSPLELLDDVSHSLNLNVVPMNWPVGMGKYFHGIVDPECEHLSAYTAEAHGTKTLASESRPWSDVKAGLDPAISEQVEEELALTRVEGDAWRSAYLAGEASPLFWGSAMTNFGVEKLLDFLVQEAAPPRGRMTEEATEIAPDAPAFTGFVFKIQANMNPKHRDRVAFLRVVSGRFERGIDVTIGRSGERLRLSRPHSFLAQERSIVEEAWPGDIVGIYDSGKLRVGDTLSAQGRVRFSGIPRFAPNFFGMLRLKDPLRRKALDAGLEQLGHEGVIQLFFRPLVGRQEPYLGAVGMLQFEVLKERLKNEYNVRAAFESLPFQHARWVVGSDADLAWIRDDPSQHLVEDRNGRPVLLSDTDWTYGYLQEKRPELSFLEIEPLD